VTFFDIGPWEFLVIAVVAVLILGPDRLPRAVSTGVRYLRVLRDQAAKARGDLMTAADLDPALTEDLKRTFNDIGELHPKRIATTFLSDAVNGTADAVNGTGSSSTGASTPPKPTSAFDPDAT
jgi:sec-independent protein translocase protein TatB